MAAWRLILAYDGADFFGWQRQSSGVTVQELVERAVAAVFGTAVPVHGASRTDAGVHALGQSAHFEQPAGTRRFSALELRNALNAHLPPQVRVVRVAGARAGFHARFAAKGKRYRYRIFNGSVMPPHELRRAWQVPPPLDLGAMRRAARELVGTHDFAAFAVVSKTKRETSVRTITRLEVSRRGRLIAVTVEGDGFLYRMVRSLVGALAHVGLGRQPPEWVGERLRRKSRQAGVVTAPPWGLYLVKVFYGDRVRR